jgi:3-phosphoshikimate 1-carboxyvinyltransferase
VSDPHLVEPLQPGFDVEVEVPGSKSLTNRALVCAALASGTSRLSGVLFADDTEAMIECVERLGATVRVDRPSALVELDGMAGRPVAGPVELDARLSGTTSRFVLPITAIGPGPYRIDGSPSLRVRPMADGISVLRAANVTVLEEGEPGHLPVTVSGWWRPMGEVVVPGDVSSQFLSGALLAAPCFATDTTVVLGGELVSEPYVSMTVAVMETFGAEVERPSADRFRVLAGGYGATDYTIEPDASAASYFFAAAAIGRGRVRVRGLGRQSLQGDLAFVGVLEQMGARVSIEADATTVEGTGTLHGVSVDLRDFSDMAQTLAVTAVFADSPTRIEGIGFIRRKETDRIGAVVRELARVGVEAEALPDGLVIHPGRPTAARIETYDDHRMAMSFALLGLRAPGIAIAEPEVVAKTFPDFFDRLAGLRV